MGIDHLTGGNPPPSKKVPKTAQKQGFLSKPFTKIDHRDKSPRKNRPKQRESGRTTTNSTKQTNRKQENTSRTIPIFLAEVHPNSRQQHGQHAKNQRTSDFYWVRQGYGRGRKPTDRGKKRPPEDRTKDHPPNSYRPERPEEQGRTEDLQGTNARQADH